MKVFLALFLVVMAMSCDAMAQERQTYTNSDISFAGNPIAQARAQLLMQPLQPRHRYRSTVPVAPVRYRQERFYDRLPYYPGDYRDAVDRGEWAAGDTYSAPYTQE